MSIEESVQVAYNEIATSFDNTRYRPWTCVEGFFSKVPTGSNIGDIGCGNGKNMFRNDCQMYGCDFCDNLVKICNHKGLNVVFGNILSIPYPDKFFDYVVCIAVLHHLSTIEKRQTAIHELKRITKPHGKILILVWAFEQDADSKRSFTEQDVYVPWKDKARNILAMRYYHLFTLQEFKDLMIGESCEFFYEKSNWGCVLTRH